MGRRQKYRELSSIEVTAWRLTIVGMILAMIINGQPS